MIIQLKIRVFLVLAVSFLAVFAIPQPSQAQSFFERLVMPGDLIEGHAKLQSDCSNCHTSFSQGAQTQLCAACHKDVESDITLSTGFHGKSPEVKASGCSHCHTDHIGKDAIIASLDRETFDHGITDFALRDSHTQATCNQCHLAEKKFSEASGKCVDCHQDQEPHRGALGKDCAACHKETTWSDTLEFDHSTTDFKLQGAHKSVTCADCHVGEVYEGLPTTCVACHRIQDVHQERFGGKCESCHVTTKWTEVRFDHDQDTDFTLNGKHADANCSSCHKTNVFQQEMASTCIDCHEKDDAHNASLGTDCATCHSSDGWLQNIRFDHDITNFPLLGLHVLATCEECHTDSTFSNAKVDCQSCHQTQDVHKGNLGVKCETCHNPNGWAFWIFDHNRQTDFSLTGAHDGLKCSTCHTPTRAVTLNISQSCVSCHKNQDVHRGTFGSQCSLCHNTSSFKGARLR